MGTAATLAGRVTAARELLGKITREHAPTVFACSFGAEDMVLVDLIARDELAIGVFTLDTGRLPEETHALIERARDRYGIRVDVFFPDRRAVETLVAEHGVNGFYRSADIRRSCCKVRKVEPLSRALVGKRSWMTGLRREQSADRGDVPLEAADEVHGLRKFNPLAWWTHDDVWRYLRQNDVPYNALHDRGYPSIGCAPCTRAIEPGEDPRSGRWWWERAERKECGLHPRAVPVHAAAVTATASEPVR
jgi:phosphoadenosine phosphosulfate reductase